MRCSAFKRLLEASYFRDLRAWTLRNQECTDKGVEDFGVWVSGAEDFRGLGYVSRVNGFGF